MTIVDTHRSSCSFQHDAFIYDSDEGYVDALVPLIEEALQAGDAVYAVVPERNAGLLRAALGAAAAAIDFIEAETWYDHPIATIAAYGDVLAGLPTGVRAFVIGEVQFGSSGADWAAWTRYEAALNRTLDSCNARVVCPYDRRALPATVIADARRTHPYLVTATDAARSADYLDPATLLPLLPPVATVPTAPPVLDLEVGGDLRAVRRAFADAAAAHGIDGTRLDDLSLAVNEILTNALVHGGGSARFRLWSDAGRGVTCVIDDGGAGVDDPLIGYCRPPEPAPGGYGAWLARRLFDRAEFLASETGGLTVILVALA